MDKPFHLQMDDIIGRLGGRRARLLLHSCCGPCSSAVIEQLSKSFDITVFFYNPNIYPLEEYRLRLETQRRLVESLGGATVTEGEYDCDRFEQAAAGLEGEKEGGARCTECFKLRLERAAVRAKECGYEFFGTTLTVSPHKNAVVINELGVQLAGRYGVDYLVADFKKREGYKRSIELSKKYGLYRQDYCGCKFSLRARENDIKN